MMLEPPRGSNPLDFVTGGGFDTMFVEVKGDQNTLEEGRTPCFGHLRHPPRWTLHPRWSRPEKTLGSEPTLVRIPAGALSAMAVR